MSIMRTALAILFLTVTLSAQEPHNPAGHASNPDYSAGFLRRAAQYCLAELEIGKMAEQKAFSIEVERYAHTMISDYTKMQNDAKALAEKLGLSLPDRLSIDDLNLKADLQSDKPEKFDLDYMDAMNRFQQKQLKAFQQDATSDRDPLIKEFASRQIPLVKSAATLAAKVYLDARNNQTTPRPKYR